MKTSLSLLVAVLSLGSSFASAASLEQADARQLAQIIENAGVKAIDTQDFKFVSGYGILCNVTFPGKTCTVSMTHKDPATTRMNVKESDVSAFLALLEKAGFKSFTSDVSDGSAGQSFVSVDTVECELNKQGGDFYAECDLK